MKDDIKSLVQETIRNELTNMRKIKQSRGGTLYVEPRTPNNLPNNNNYPHTSELSDSNSVNTFNTGNTSSSPTNYLSAINRKDSLETAIERKVGQQIAKLTEELELLKQSKGFVIPLPTENNNTNKAEYIKINTATTANTSPKETQNNKKQGKSVKIHISPKNALNNKNNQTNNKNNSTNSPRNKIVANVNSISDNSNINNTKKTSPNKQNALSIEQQYILQQQQQVEQQQQVSIVFNIFCVYFSIYCTVICFA